MKYYLLLSPIILSSFVSKGQFTCSTVDLKPTITFSTNPIVPILGKPTEISASFEYDSRKAYNEYITLTVEKFSWSGGGISGNTSKITVNPTFVTTYSCEVTYYLVYSPDASNIQAARCYITKTTTVVPNIAPFAIAGPDQTIGCFGGSVQINGSASGTNSPFTYSWSPSTGLSSTTIPNPIASPSSTTTYRLTVTDSKGLKGADDVIIYVPISDDSPSIEGNTSVYRPCPKQSARYYFSLQSVPSNATNFAWQTDFGYISKLFYTGSRATGIEITVGVAPLPEVRVATISGDYFTVTCIATYPCGNKTGTKNVNLEFPVCAFPRDPGPIRFPQQALTLEGTSSKTLAYPNPSTGTINFQFILDHPSNVSIEILDSFGRSYSKNNLGLMEEGIYSENLEINQNGNYFILLNDGNKTKLTRIIIAK